MRIEFTKQEVVWLAELAEKEKHRAISTHEQTPHPLLELRRDNMADLEEKLRTSVQNKINRERKDAR